ncbi:abasic site processing protein HMCES [Monomorium pharaonis]|uniref:abasic site processing protein HMCES n=1 Tax=Monomorium pharaonis TaxID=307658 RepID=UPI00063FD1CA|nr:abasic site processing protein HMCES [Monomorium pharaonis]
MKMCGRICCSLNADTLCCACGYKDASGKQRKLTWVKTELKYDPSYNMCPRDVLPCIASGLHFEGEKEERVLCAMTWGVIPPWYQGDYKKCSNKISTHNSRLESIQTSTIYSPSLQKQQRCIVVCEGFYEWKPNTNSKLQKQPYYIYATQDKDVKADDPTTWVNEFCETDGWKGFKVLKLAGIFGTHKTEEGNIIHSCSIITRESNQVLSWLHHRMPICLSNEEECQIWLSKALSTDVAVKTLNDIILKETVLNWHPVSTVVNNGFNKAVDCRKKIKSKEISQASFMTSWLQKGSTTSNKRKSDDKDTITNEDKNISKLQKN